MIELGAEVSSPTRLFRRQTGKKRTWVPVDHPVEGIYIGWRTYSNGEIEWSYDEPTVWHPKEYLKVALIVPSIREAPIPVLFSEMVG
jgi:hypothetical protein